MFRVVLDTNVLISASLSSEGSSARLLRLLADDVFRIVISVPLVLEYEAVLTRMSDRSGWTSDDIEAALEFVCKVGEPGEAHFSSRPALKDPGDEFVLELAHAAGVDYLVTSNVRDFVGSAEFGVTVMTPGQFAGLLERQP